MCTLWFNKFHELQTIPERELLCAFFNNVIFKERTCATVKSQRHGYAGCTVGSLFLCRAVRHSLNGEKRHNLHAQGRFSSYSQAAAAIRLQQVALWTRAESTYNVTAACLFLKAWTFQGVIERFKLTRHSGHHFQTISELHQLIYVSCLSSRAPLSNEMHVG